jgi:diguanylate cyclase (GGDEF)-like protein
MQQPARPTVLVVRGITTSSTDLEGLVSALGSEVFVAESAIEALARAAERSPDVVVTDVLLQGNIDGIDLATGLERRFGTSIVYLSGRADDATVGRALATDPAGYLVEPVTPSELKCVVELAALRRHSRAQAAEHERREATLSAQLHALLGSLRVGVLVTDERRRVLHVNSTLVTMLGLELSPPQSGVDALESLAPARAQFTDPERFAARLAELLTSRAAALDEALEAVDGRYLERDCLPVEVDDTYQGHVLVFRDVTERERSRAALLEHTQSMQTLSLVDELTGLYNRRGFLALASKRAEAVLRSGQLPVLLFLDLDGMKWINDYLGHNAGDQALRDTARLLRNTFRLTDVIGRLGGDEFVVLAPMAAGSSPELARSRWLTAVQAFNEQKSRTYDLSVSVGAVVCNPGEPVGAALERADAEMYADKRARRQVR